MRDPRGAAFLSDLRKLLDVFVTFLRLGCISFGGPVAHLAFFHREFVERRRWIDDSTFAACIALTQLLPGPASSQTGMLLGWLRAGWPGAVGAWIGFTLPSAVLMTMFALILPRANAGAGWLHGLLLAAVAIVAGALATLRSALAPDLARSLLAVAVLALVLALPYPLVTPLAIGGAAFAGMLLRGSVAPAQTTLDLHVSKRAGIIALAMLALSFAALALWASGGAPLAVLTNTLFRVGALVFGGGHVVLPLLQTQVAGAGIVGDRSVLEGYALAQAVPGPLFTIASYVGASAWGSTLGVRGAAVATIAIFAPSFFLLAGVAPFYRQLVANARFRAALAGANAGVVGLLAAAFVNPIFATSVRSPLDFAAAFAAFAAMQYAKVPAWVMVILAALFGYVVER